MSGTLWAILAGVGFGIFQTLNRRAVQGMDVYAATLMQLGISALVLIAIALATLDVSMLAQAPLISLIYFALAGLFHFFVGWTFLNSSQKRIGAARTSAFIGTTPLFAAVFALFTLGEIPGWLGLGGIGLIVLGVFLTNRKRAASTAHNPGSGMDWQGWLLGLAAPVCWAISPIFIRYGLEGLPSPLLGVTVGISVSALGYAIAFGVRSLRTPPAPIPTEAMAFKIVAAVLVGLSTWLRWIALDMTAVAAVLALSLISVPTVNLLTPLVVERHVEQVTAQVWLGSMLIVGGSLILILTP